MPTAPGGRRFIIQKGDIIMAGSTGRQWQYDLPLTGR